MNNYIKNTIKVFVGLIFIILICALISIGLLAVNSFVWWLHIEGVFSLTVFNNIMFVFYATCFLLGISVAISPILVRQDRL